MDIERQAVKVKIEEDINSSIFEIYCRIVNTDSKDKPIVFDFSNMKTELEDDN